MLTEHQSGWDEEARTFKRTPNHDWASHAADAWGYLSVGWNYAPKPQEKKNNDPRTNERGEWVLTVDELLDIHVAKTSESKCEGCAEPREDETEDPAHTAWQSDQ